ncbi:MAG: YeiH family protein, partial [Thermodesulfobacteriota bacterium]
SSNPLDAIPSELIIPLLLLFISLGVLMTVGISFMKSVAPKKYIVGFLFVFILAIISYLFANQVTIKQYGLGYALWALLIGLLIANTVGTPDWLKAGARSEMYIKTGLVLLGAEILFTRILKLGGPGLIVAWGVTPVVVIFMYLFVTKLLKITSKSLTIVIATATSVCGVSAAIAAAAASRAKREELTLAVGMTMIFTVIMMIAMPALAKILGLNNLIGGAWLGGTIDSTGAVVAAGALIGEQAEKVAAVVKMIQNILIGFIAFAIAVYWVSVVEKDESSTNPSLMEIWYRFPKFILGFILASLVFSLILMPIMGEEHISAILKQTKTFRGWFFCMAFISIGLESDFRDLSKHLAGGKPILLYVTGQSFNIILTLIMAWLAFGLLWRS